MVGDVNSCEKNPAKRLLENTLVWALWTLRLRRQRPVWCPSLQAQFEHVYFTLRIFSLCLTVTSRAISGECERKIICILRLCCRKNISRIHSSRQFVRIHSVLVLARRHVGLVSGERFFTDHSPGRLARH